MHCRHQPSPSLSRSAPDTVTSTKTSRFRLPALALLCLASVPVLADDSDSGTHYIPLLQYDYVSLGHQAVQSPGLGMAILNPDLMLVGMYTRHEVSEPPASDSTSRYHSVDLSLQARKARHNYLAFFSSASDQPVRGGLNTYTAGALYGYDVLASDPWTLTLGGGLAVGDFGIETAAGDPWPVIPVPLLRLDYQSESVEASADFIASPGISFVVGPNNPWRLAGEMRVSDFEDVRDIAFDLSLAYRLFPGDHPMGDFAGVSLGIKNDGYAFDLSDDEGTYRTDYYAGYLSLDATFLTFTGGYAVAGREIHSEAGEQSLGDGFFVSLQGMYPLQW